MTTQCLTCKFAAWEKTANGRLHPSGDGRCTWKMPDVPIPICMYFFGAKGHSPMGGYISRHPRHKQEDCPCYERA